MKLKFLKNTFLFCLSLSFLFAYSGCKSLNSDSSDLDLYIAENKLINSQSSTSVDNSAGSTTATTTSGNMNYLLPNIDLNNWKITLPIGNPTSVRPPEILDYANSETLKPFFYNDSIDGSLVFYAYPKSTTANSSYSRTELREQMVPGSDNTNWTFAEGGRMRGVLSVPEVSLDRNGKPHKVIIMQIHGRLTNVQRDLIGEDDNNAPPMLKIYWDKGRVRIKTKVVKDLNASYEELLHESAWGDDDGYTIPIDVGHNKFTLEVIVSDGNMEIIFNDLYSIIYNSIHIQKWGIFENYFKAGNYFQSRDENSFARVKYYELEISHD
ncbi:MAG: polysaccharide lyase family 7 protein [Candidatus Arcticimaribacter sp.]|nr:MAG: polysaccharide lyase family 7 protein [Candidatus Arcticimaribacter sp.]